MKYKILYYPVVLALIIFFTSCSDIKGNIYRQENNMDIRFLRLSRKNPGNNNDSNYSDNSNNSYNNDNSHNNNSHGNDNSDNNDRGHADRHNNDNNNDNSSIIQKSEKKFKLYIKDTDEIELWTELTDTISLITKFSKKDWGTWNIKGWYTAENHTGINNEKTIDKEKISKDKGVNIITGGSTDWEYVLRIVNPQGNKWYFSGGNHGNERLKSISFLGVPSQKTSDDNDIAVEINLEPGKIIELKSLNVTEVTALDVEQIDLKEYATVYREYTFEPQRVQLTTRIKFNNNVHVGTSYVAMFPIMKEFGRYCRFDDVNLVIETPKTGFTEGGEGKERYLGKVATLSTTIWGENDTGYKFRVWIEGPEMADNFSNQLKVFLWDVNKFSNKLYYSKYDTSRPVEVKTGTEWYHKQGWDFIYKE